ncbi:MAG TPA: hypothetical protein VFZ61_25445, partial [Polyangiales bacterium]
MTTTKTSQLKHFTFAALWLAIGCSADADLKDPNGSAGASDAAAQPGSASPDGADGSTSGVAPVQPGASPPKGCAAVSQTAQNRRQPADIIIGVDTSGSMGQEAMFVQQNMNAFSQQI